MHAHEGLLGDVPGQVTVLHDAERHGVHPSLVTDDEFPERLRVAAPGSFHQFEIGQSHGKDGVGEGEIHRRSGKATTPSRGYSDACASDGVRVVSRISHPLSSVPGRRARSVLRDLQRARGRPSAPARRRAGRRPRLGHGRRRPRPARRGRCPRGGLDVSGVWLRPAALAVAVVSAASAVGWAGWTLWRTAWGAPRGGGHRRGGRRLAPLGPAHRRRARRRPPRARGPGPLDRPRRRAHGPHRSPGPRDRPAGRHPGPTGAPGRAGRSPRSLAAWGVAALVPGPNLGRGWSRLVAGMPARPARPRAEPITGDVEITYRYPAHTGRPERKVPGSDGSIQAPRGTEVRPLDPLRSPGEGGADRHRGSGSRAAPGRRARGEGRARALRLLPGRGAGQLPVPVHRR